MVIWRLNVAESNLLPVMAKLGDDALSVGTDLIDKLVVLYQSAGENSLIVYTEVVALLGEISELSGDRSPELHSVLQLKISDLLAPFASRSGVLPASAGKQHEEAFLRAIEWVRYYFSPGADPNVLLQESETRASYSHSHKVKTGTPWKRMRNMLPHRRR